MRNQHGKKITPLRNPSPLPRFLKPPTSIHSMLLILPMQKLLQKTLFLRISPYLKTFLRHHLKNLSASSLPSKRREKTLLLEKKNGACPLAHPRGTQGF